MKIKIFLVLFLFSQHALCISFLQEEKDIICQSRETQLIVEKKDRYFYLNSKKYLLVEFLDSAILARSEDDDFALVQLLPKNEAVVVEGEMVTFQEKECQQVQANKVCENEFGKFDWSPTELGISGKQSPVIQYGVYPNDGTYFISFSDNQGISLIDLGSKFFVVFGKAARLRCQYQP